MQMPLYFKKNIFDGSEQILNLMLVPFSNFNALLSVNEYSGIFYP